MTFRRKLIVAFVYVLVLVGVQGAIAGFILTQMVEGAAARIGPALSRIDSLAHLESDLVRLRTLDSSLRVGDSATRAVTLEQIEALQSSIPMWLNQYRSSESSLDGFDAID